MNNISRFFVILIFILPTVSGFAFPSSLTVSQNLAVAVNVENNNDDKPRVDANVLDNGQIRLVFYNDHVSYSFSEEVKKAINNSNADHIAAFLMVTDATSDRSVYSDNGNVSADGGNFPIKNLETGIFTVVITTGSGEYKISGLLEGGMPVITGNPNHAFEIISQYDDGNFIISSDPNNNRLYLTLHKHIADSLLKYSDEDVVFIGFIPENKSNATVNGGFLPGDTKTKYSLREIFQSEDKRDWTGSVVIILMNNEATVNTGCALNFYKGYLINTPEIKDKE